MAIIFEKGCTIFQKLTQAKKLGFYKVKFLAEWQETAVAGATGLRF